MARKELSTDRVTLEGPSTFALDRQNTGLGFTSIEIRAASARRQTTGFTRDWRRTTKAVCQVKRADKTYSTFPILCLLLVVRM